MYTSDTIAAISTPHGHGGIGIVRMSGDKAFLIAEKIFSGKKDFSLLKSQEVAYGKIVEPESGKILDEVLILKMKAPHTYTREDIVEISCHGGMVVVRGILELVLSLGARLAEPGEFTKRAFLNGRIDLSQAEAVIDLISAKTEESSKAAIDQLEGKISQRIREIRGKLIELLAHIEVTVDYPEHDTEEITGQKVQEDCEWIEEQLVKLLRGFDRGRILREGIYAVIVGRPNVGKSSLMNELAGKTRAIVTEIPGTTRDTIEEYVSIHGIPVRLVDTAGIRQTEDLVEKIGVEKARKEIDKADLLILMLDGTSGILDEDRQLIKESTDRKRIFIINKMDAADALMVQKMEEELGGKNIIKMSLKQDVGIEELEKEISRLFTKGEVSLGTEPLLTNVRHKELLDQGLKCIRDAKEAVFQGLTLDCIAIDIKSAAEALGQITGESVSEDVMHEIFSRFCLGK